MSIAVFGLFLPDVPYVICQREVSEINHNGGGKCRLIIAGFSFDCHSVKIRKWNLLLSYNLSRQFFFWKVYSLQAPSKVPSMNILPAHSLV